jgi:hypothetical protein
MDARVEARNLSTNTITATSTAGVANDFTPSGTIEVVPPADRPPVPSNGRISPAPNQPVFAVPSNYAIPQVHSYNFTIQRLIGGGVTLDIGYVGSLAS